MLTRELRSEFLKSLLLSLEQILHALHGLAAGCALGSVKDISLLMFAIAWTLVMVIGGWGRTVRGLKFVVL